MIVLGPGDRADRADARRRACTATWSTARRGARGGGGARMTLLAVAGPRQALRRPDRHRRRRPDRRAGRGARGDRPQRRRQDHADQPALRRDRARRRQHPLRRPRHHARAGVPARADGPRALVPDHVGVPRIQRAGERDARGAGACRATASRFWRPLAAETALVEPRARRARAGGPGGSAPTCRWRRSRTASGGSSRSR